jgi:hypothetical protein
VLSLTAVFFKWVLITIDSSVRKEGGQSAEDPIPKDREGIALSIDEHA